MKVSGLFWSYSVRCAKGIVSCQLVRPDKQLKLSCRHMSSYLMFKSRSPPTELTVGFVGAGRMCQALSKGFTDAGLVNASNVICSDPSPETLDMISKSQGIKVTIENEEILKFSDVILLAVKPHMIPDVLQQASNYLKSTPTDQDKLFVSIAAGVTINQIEQKLPRGARVIRVMPNTPALVQCAASVYSPGSCSTEDDEEIVRKLFSCIGYCESLPERNLDAVTGVSGSGPAYVFMAIEALADGGVKMGLPRDIAQQLAAQTLMGAAKMVLETDQHPGQLKDAVCSPGGTTIAAVHHLEASGFRGALMGAVEAAAKRATELGAPERTLISEILTETENIEDEVGRRLLITSRIN